MTSHEDKELALDQVIKSLKIACTAGSYYRSFFKRKTRTYKLIITTFHHDEK